MADVGLRARREDRLRQLLGLLQSARQRDAGDGAARLVVLPAGAGDVAAHDALDRQHLQAAHDERAPERLLGHAVGRRDHVVGDDLRGLLKPEDGQPGEHLALVGDRRRVDGVVRRDAVARDHQERRRRELRRGGEVVHLAYLPAGEEGQVGERRHLSRCYQRDRASRSAICWREWARAARTSR